MVVPVPVCAAACYGDVDSLRAYFASGDRDPNDLCAGNGQTLLDYACVGNTDEGESVISCEAISFLLSQGASVDYQDPSGTWHRPLVVAAMTCSQTQTAHRWGHPPITDPLKLLIEAGADVNADPGLGAAPGWPPIMQGVVEGNMEVVKFLLSRCRRRKFGTRRRVDADARSHVFARRSWCDPRCWSRSTAGEGARKISTGYGRGGIADRRRVLRLSHARR